MPRVARAVSVLSLVSQMVNAHNEEEFAAFEEQFWAILRGGEDPKVLAVAPGVHIDGQQLIRACRKIKTRNGRQKGFFKKTKEKEKQQAKQKGKSAKK